MKKTIPTSIASTLFYIEEDSYQKLDNYLSEIKKYFGSYEDKIDIVGDIESRIREQLLQFSEEDKTEHIVTEAHIDKLIKNMGWPEEFGTFEPSTEPNKKKDTETNAKTEKTRRRLYRDKDNAIIGGVASGVALYFDIDPIIVRALFLISIFFGGAGILIYIILWLVVPKAETATEILEMQGDPLNLNEVKKIVEEKIQELNNKEKIESNAKNFFEELRTLLLKFGGKFFKIISKIIGVVLKIFSLTGMTVMFVGIVLVLVSYHTGDTDLRELNSLPYFYILSFILFLIGLIPFLFLNKIANLFLGKKAFQRIEYAGFLFSLWIAMLILGPVLLFYFKDAYVEKARLLENQIKADKPLTDTSIETI